MSEDNSPGSKDKTKQTRTPKPLFQVYIRAGEETQDFYFPADPKSQTLNYKETSTKINNSPNTHKHPRETRQKVYGKQPRRAQKAQREREEDEWEST